MPEALDEECQVCIDWKEPCDDCAKEIHKAWHARGWSWIRHEECDVTCPGFKHTIAQRLRIIEVTPRELAREKQLRRGP